MIVCVCHGVNEKTIHQAVSQGATTLGEISFQTGATTCCGKCSDCTQVVIDEALSLCYDRAA